MQFQEQENIPLNCFKRKLEEIDDRTTYTSRKEPNTEEVNVTDAEASSSLPVPSSTHSAFKACTGRSDPSKKPGNPMDLLMSQVKNIGQRSDIEQVKDKLRKHPMLPLLSQLLERCGETTTSAQELSKLANEDVNLFFQQICSSTKSCFSGDDETDTLILKGIQVMKMYLSELDRVQEVSKTFKSHYVSSIQTRLSGEDLLKRLGVEENSQTSPQLNQDINMFESMINNPVSEEGTTHKIELPAPHLQNTALDMQYKYEQLSKYAWNPAPKKSPSRRGILPKAATEQMKDWLFKHLGHPYPSEDEKRKIAQQTGLTILQVNNWFINARRRILQPMMNEAAAQNRGHGTIRNTANKRIKLNIPMRREEHCWSKSPTSPSTPITPKPLSAIHRPSPTMATSTSSLLSPLLAQTPLLSPPNNFLETLSNYPHSVEELQKQQALAALNTQALTLTEAFKKQQMSAWLQKNQLQDVLQPAMLLNVLLSAQSENQGQNGFPKTSSVTTPIGQGCLTSQSPLSFSGLPSLSTSTSSMGLGHLSSLLGGGSFSSSLNSGLNSSLNSGLNCSLSNSLNNSLNNSLSNSMSNNNSLPSPLLLPQLQSIINDNPSSKPITQYIQANGQIYQAQIVPVTGPLTSVANTEIKREISS